MGSLMSFESIFKVDFPTEIADQVLGRIQALYGTQFDKNFGHLDPHELQTLACTVLCGLNSDDLKRGIDRMNSEKWCPTLPEFRSWCIVGGEWWTAEQAWVKVLNFINDRSKQITTIAKASLDEIQVVLDQEGQKAAHRAFVAIYDDYLQRAKAKGRVQEFWKASPQLGNNPDASHRPVKVDVMAEMKKAYAKAGRA